MKDWKRIVFVIVFLFGATLSFGYWSINQFDDVFDSLTASLTAIIPPVDSRSTISETSTSASSTSPIDQDNLAGIFWNLIRSKISALF